MAGDGDTVLGTETSIVRAASVRAQAFGLPAGTYKFEVSAINAIGDGPGARSELVSPR